MRQISEAFAARLAANTTTLCACWLFKRRDGERLGATDHDRSIIIDDVACLPSSGIRGAMFETSSGLAPGRGTAAGALSLDFMADADLDAGIWDGALVDVWRVDWLEPIHRILIWSGRLSEVERQGQAFTAELVSLKADLEKTIGRVYARRCDADVGDGRCNVDLTDPAYRAEGVVSAVLSERRFAVEGIDAFDSGWFTDGHMSWVSGSNAGASVRIQRHAGTEIEVSSAPRFAVASEDAFVVTAGCDKAFATCSTKFANGMNFRGFPHMPGPEAVLAGPASGGVNDGGKR